MKLYETTFILNSQADDGTLDQQVKAITNLISTNGGKIVAEDRLGTRRMAYSINKMIQGYYTSILFEGEPGIPLTLERFFKLDDAYIRHLTILFEGDPQVVKEKQEAMSKAMEAHDRPRRHERGDSRGGGQGRFGRRSRYDDDQPRRDRPMPPGNEATAAPADAPPAKRSAEKPQTQDRAAEPPATPSAPAEGKADKPASDENEL